MSFKDVGLTIASGQTESAIENLQQYHGPARPWAFLIVSPSTLPETVKIHVQVKSGGQFGVLQSGGTDIVLAAGVATQITILGAYGVKLVAGVAVAANRNFEVSIGEFP